MLRYFDFINEGLSYQQSKFYYSPEFRRILSIVVDKHRDSIASLILSSEDVDSITDNISFIDKTSKNDMVSFIQQNRISRMYDESKIEGETFSDWIKRVSSDMDSKIWKSQRSELAIGRFARRVVAASKVRLIQLDSKIEEFVNRYKSLYDNLKDGDLLFELVSGEEIRKWYLVDNYESETGQLGNSCMRKKNCQPFFDIYTKNPDKVKLLILKSKDNPSKIAGRALVWKINDKFFMDRVYTIRDSDYLLFKNYCETNSWMSSISYSDFRKMNIQLDKWEFSAYPYMDTFKYLNHKTGVLSADDGSWPSSNVWKLEDTTGGYDDDDVVWSDYHGEHIDRDSAILCRNGDWVYEDSAIYLEYLDDFASPSEETCYSEYDSCSYYTDDAVYSEYLNSYIRSRDAIEIIISCDYTEDYIHIDDKKFIITANLEKDEKVKTIEKYAIFDPISKEYYLKDYKIDGKDIKQYIVDSNPDRYEISELENYIINSDFSIKDNVEKFSFIFEQHQRQVGGWDINSLIRNRKYDELTNLIKCMLIISPKESEMSSFRNKYGLILKNREDIINKLMSNDIRNIIGKNDFSLVNKFIKISQLYASDIIKDEKMLITWYASKI